MKIYLDVCCLNRPFDNARQPRVAMQADAVERVLQLIDSGRIVDYSSAMATVEIERIAESDRRRRVSALLPDSARILPLSESLLDEAGELQRVGFDLADAVHLAAAARWNVDVFLTVDDRLLRRADRGVGNLRFRVLDPVMFVQEFDDDAASTNR